MLQPDDVPPNPAGYRAAVKRLPESGAHGLHPLRISLAATFRADGLADYLKVECARRGFDVTLQFSPYGQFEIDCSHAGSALFTGNPEFIAIAARLEDLAPGLWHRPDRQALVEQACERVRQMIENVRRFTRGSIIVFNYTHPLEALDSPAALVTWANNFLEGICRDQVGVYPFDLARMALEMGLRQLYDARLDYLARSPFSVAAQIEIARKMARLIRAIHVPPIKCLVLDMDNTLWGGEIGEVGAGGIDLGNDYPGSAYRDFQRAVRGLRERGILLAIASKNNEGEVRSEFARHPEMVLRWEDFAAVEIHWLDKVSSLRRIAERLHIGLDSIAFYDDDAVERESVRSQLPEVHAIEVPADPLRRVASLVDAEVFDRIATTQEDLQRAAYYRQEQQRAEERRQSHTLEEFLAQLDIRAVTGSVDQSTLRRVAQLVNKTNQFNLTTRRRTEAELLQQLDSGAIGLWLRVSDRFGDYGLVGAAFAVPENAKEWRIDNFVLSCRILGRQVETVLLSALARRVQETGAETIVGDYLPTPRNTVAAEFFASHGFELNENRWIWSFARGRIETPSTVAVGDEGIVVE